MKSIKRPPNMKERSGLEETEEVLVKWRTGGLKDEGEISISARESHAEGELPKEEGFSLARERVSESKFFSGPAGSEQGIKRQPKKKTSAYEKTQKKSQEGRPGPRTFAQGEKRQSRSGDKSTGETSSS